MSGSTLHRPSLERLRDAAYVGSFKRLYVHSPDRLARKYAYQVLIVDELQKHGIEIVFLNRAIGVSPEEDLFLQMQGMFAEYERAKIMERSRRGKRHAATRGSVNVLSAAPFGYADDFVVLCRTQAEAEGALQKITQWVEQAGLTLHPTKTKIVDSRVESFAFLGYSFRGGKIYPRRESLAKMKARICTLINAAKLTCRTSRITSGSLTASSTKHHSIP